jgi:phage shock protein E
MAGHSGFEKLVAEAKKKITEISPTEAAAKSKSGETVIIDVREKDEWDEEHIPDATHMSRGTIELDIEEKVPDSDAMIICHCGGGGRSALAAENLQKMGYKTSAPWPAVSKPGEPQACQRPSNCRGACTKRL